MKMFRRFLMCGFLVASLLLVGCNENQRAKSLGGTAKKELPAGRKLVTVTWKEANLWVLTRPMNEDEKPEEYEFQEESSWGLIEGKVIFKEMPKKEAEAKK